MHPRSTSTCETCGTTMAYAGYRLCRRCRAFCPCREQRHVTVRKANGTLDVRLQCLACGARTAGVKHSDVPDVNALPIVVDHLLEVREAGIVCARCSSPDGVEQHHWAPRAIFGFEEAERWPQSPLCPDCHRTWHRTMRQAGRVGA